MRLSYTPFHVHENGRVRSVKTIREVANVDIIESWPTSYSKEVVAYDIVLSDGDHILVNKGATKRYIRHTKYQNIIDIFLDTTDLVPWLSKHRDATELG